MINSKKSSGMSKRAKNNQMGDFQRGQLSWHMSHMSGYLIKPIKDNEDFKEGISYVKKRQNQLKPAQTVKMVI